MKIVSKTQKGFTIVELIVVIVVIGILASIAIVSYGGWRQRSAQNEVKSDLSGAIAALENARNFDNSYPATMPTTFDESTNVDLTYTRSGDTLYYCLNGVSSVDLSVQFYVKPPTAITPTAGMCGLP